MRQEEPLPGSGLVYAQESLIEVEGDNCCNTDF